MTSPMKENIIAEAHLRRTAIRNTAGSIIGNRDLSPIIAISVSYLCEIHRLFRDIYLYRCNCLHSVFYNLLNMFPMMRTVFKEKNAVKKLMADRMAVG